MLSRQRISRSQLPHEDGGRSSERRAGTRATTTFRKLPSASAGASVKTAAAAFIGYSPVEASKDDAVRAQTFVVIGPVADDDRDELHGAPGRDGLPGRVRVDPVALAVGAGQRLHRHLRRAGRGSAGVQPDAVRGARLIRGIGRVRRQRRR